MSATQGDNEDQTFFILEDENSSFNVFKNKDRITIALWDKNVSDELKVRSFNLNYFDVKSLKTILDNYLASKK